MATGNHQVPTVRWLQDDAYVSIVVPCITGGGFEKLGAYIEERPSESRDENPVAKDTQCLCVTYDGEVIMKEPLFGPVQLLPDMPEEQAKARKKDDAQLPRAKNHGMHQATMKVLKELGSKYKRLLQKLETLRDLPPYIVERKATVIDITVRKLPWEIAKKNDVEPPVWPHLFQNAQFSRLHTQPDWNRLKSDPVVPLDETDYDAWVRDMMRDRLAKEHYMWQEQQEDPVYLANHARMQKIHAENLKSMDAVLDDDGSIVFTDTDTDTENESSAHSMQDDDRVPSNDAALEEFWAEVISPDPQAATCASVDAPCASSTGEQKETQ